MSRGPAFRVRWWRLLASIAFAFGIVPAPTFAQPVDAYGEVSIEAFDSALSPYGEWIFIGRVGRVWRPYQTAVGFDFRPYLTGGHWVYTDFGWTFESDYDWGWAPFHYGRWLLDNYYGWVWTPDTVWGPAWVDWRFGGGYVGWAPLAPVGFSIAWGAYQPTWCFVPVTHFVVHDVYRHALSAERFHWAYSITSPIREPIHHAGVQWNAGPPPGQVSYAIGRPIQPMSIAPPAPGHVQAVRVGAPSGTSAAVVSPSPARALPPSGSAFHAPAPAVGAPSGLSSRAAPSSAAPVAAPPSGAVSGNPRAAHSPGEARWGPAPRTDAAPWSGGPRVVQPEPAPATPATPSGSARPLPSTQDGHWGRSGTDATPHFGGSAAPSTQPARPPPPQQQPAPAASHPGGSASRQFSPPPQTYSSQYVRPSPPVAHAPTSSYSSPAPQPFARAPSPSVVPGGNHGATGFGGRPRR
jgi:hypothetical protein